MYIPPAFKVHPALALAFATARGFGVVTACDGGRPVATNVPFVVTETHGKSPRVTFHVARGNALAALAAKGGEWLIAVQGADAYVSPNWYVSSEQVPTWLYESVQLSGPVSVVPPAHAAAHLDAITARFEQPQGLQAAWSTARLSPQRLATLSQMIVVIDMLVETVEGSFKLNQHKANADYVAVASALAAEQDAGARAIAARMVALRPHFLYEKHHDKGVAADASNATPSHGGGH